MASYYRQRRNGRQNDLALIDIATGATEIFIAF
jgi:hypothetical protein